MGNLFALSHGPFTHHEQPQGLSARVLLSRLQTLFTALLRTSQLLASSGSQMSWDGFPNETLHSEERYTASPPRVEQGTSAQAIP